MKIKYPCILLMYPCSPAIFCKNEDHNEVHLWAESVGMCVLCCGRTPAPISSWKQNTAGERNKKQKICAAFPW